MQTLFKKHYFFIILIIFCLQQFVSGQMVLTGLYKNETVEQAYKQLPKKQQKSTNFIYYEPIRLPFIDDFSRYTGYPDTARWIGRQAFVNQSFAVNPPTIGCVTLDALDEKGRIYEHASKSNFGADTLLSRPIRLDSIFYPFPKALIPRDSIMFCFFYQPGGGDRETWEVGNAPDKRDSLILEFAYQTGNITLLHYTIDSVMMFDTISVGDTIWSHCDRNLFIISEDIYYPGDMIALPCDSVTAMEVVWQKVWASEGMTLTAFKKLYGTDFRQVIIPVVDNEYFNKGFQFRFRNYASLEYNNAVSSGNVDHWNIDYIRLNHSMSIADTAIDDVAIVDNPGSMLKKYTSMPWKQFKDNKSLELKSKFDLKLTNLHNVVKNTSYYYTVLDKNRNSIGNYSGGSENIYPFHTNGYQDYAPHANPPSTGSIESTITFPSSSSDSTELLIMHVFGESGSGDQNQNNDTVRFLQKFHNYFAYDDGSPESGSIVTSPNAPYEAALAVQFTMNKPDTLQAIDIYINHTYEYAFSIDFTLTIWEDNQGLPGEILYSQRISQQPKDELYGFQRFLIDEPFVISGNIYVGYQTLGNKFLNVGFDQNNDNSQNTFWKTTGNSWNVSFLAGSPMIRPVVGKTFPVSIRERKEIPLDAKIYPNPAKDKLHIELSQDIEQENIISSIYSVTGQKIYENNYSSEIMLDNYLPGFYILRLTDTKKRQTSTYKFLISQ